MDHDEKAVPMEPIQAAQALDFSLMALFARASLTVQVVMVLLIVASAWAWAIIIQKFLVFAQARKEAPRFDRPFCERLSKGFQVKAWTCSHSEIAWSGFGFEGSKLGYLLTQCGWFHQGHRAVEDCHALLEVLASPLPSGAGFPFGHLLTSARKALVRIWAEGSPFDMKDMLKARRYRWNDGTDGRPKAWWVEVDEEAFEAEIAFLRREVYRREVEPFCQRTTAFERFRSAR